MDMKTLEWLRERLKKSDTIRDCIKTLKERIERIDKTAFITLGDNADWLVTIEERYGEVDKLIIAALTEQIDQLEEEIQADMNYSIRQLTGHIAALERGIDNLKRENEKLKRGK